jgi:hypothetical protein
VGFAPRQEGCAPELGIAHRGDQSQSKTSQHGNLVVLDALRCPDQN